MLPQVISLLSAPCHKKPKLFNLANRRLADILNESAKLPQHYSNYPSPCCVFVSTHHKRRTLVPLLLPPSTGHFFTLPF